jgi:soluble lytic murein transglycosylase-like protein
MTITHENDLVGEQKGDSSPVLATTFALTAVALGLFLPLQAMAATTYLINNAEEFVEYTQNSYGEMIDIAALLHDYDPKMITAVIVVESEGKTLALSNKGARGLMQLMPGTAKAMGASDPKDPFQNILAGTKYLKELEDRYGFEDVGSALVAYNMGPSRAKRWLSQYDAAEYGYVKKVMYVYDVLAEKEAKDRSLAANLRSRIDAHTGSGVGGPIMTKPRTLSLISTPLSFPVLGPAID